MNPSPTPYLALLTVLVLGLAGLATVQAQPAAKKIGPEFQVNTYVTSSQSNPAVTMDSAGNFVVVWDSVLQDGSSSGIFGQRFDGMGSPLGTEFRVNTYTLNTQRQAAIGMDAAGGFVVVWESSFQDDDSFGVFAQRFDSEGAKAGVEFQVNTTTVASQDQPAIGMNASGEFVVVFRDDDGVNSEIYLQRFDSYGSPLGGEYRVNTYTTDDQQRPSVGLDSNGAFVVAWDSFDSGSGLFGVFAQAFDAAGVPDGMEFQVPVVTAPTQFGAAVGMRADGEFVVSWESNPQDGSSSGIFAQAFDASANRKGSVFQVNSFTTEKQRVPAVAMNDAGEFVVVWQSFGQEGTSDYGVFGQARSLSNGALGGEFHVNTTAANQQVTSDVAMDAAGNFVVVWQSNLQDGYNYGVFGQRFLAPCREELALPQNEWRMISLPCEPAGGSTVQDVFGDDLPVSGYGASWHVYRWNAATPAYELLALTDTVDISVGYWIKTTLPGMTVDVAGNNVDYSCAGSSTFDPLGGCYETASLEGAAGVCDDADLSDGRFNLMGMPFRMQVNLAGALFDDAGTERTAPSAEANGLASDMAWTWNGAAYQAGDSCTPGMEATFDTWDAFWIDVCDDDATPLELFVPARPLDLACSPPPPPSGPEGETATLDAASRERFEPGNGRGQGGGGGNGKPPKSDFWYVRLVASADGLSDPGNVLGELPDSVLGYDAHDLVELQPFGASWLTVVFPHLDWGADSSEWYTSDYHGPKDPREWSFEVRSSSPRTVTLTWELTGDEKLLRRMELVDEATGVAVPAGEGSYTFTMNTTRHTFTWHEVKGGGPPRR